MKPPLVEHAPTIARINVTPIIDVALVLVIILLITAPMITAANMDVDLPHARSRSIEDEARVSITLGREGELAIDDQEIPRAALIRVLSARLAESAKDNMLVVVRADGAAPHEAVRKILDDARSAGAKRIAIATRQRGKRSR